MLKRCLRRVPTFSCLLAAVCTVFGGCTTVPHVPPQVPHELAQVTMPDYVIHPPDILVIDALRVIPQPPYRIEPLDSLVIQVTETFPDQPIAGLYVVEPEGTVNLGFNYGSVRVAQMSLEEAKAALEQHLKQILKPGYQVSVALGQLGTRLQQIRGEHLVRPDGRISLGTYGSVRVADLTIDEARAAIEAYLSRYLVNPQISLDVGGYNTSVYYVITDGAGNGELVYRFPIQGHETVLDAISQIYGLPAVASKRRIWVARPAPSSCDGQDALPVDWVAITKRGATATNYQLMPGDRVYVASQPLIQVDNALAKLISPVERIFGITLLGSSTVQSVKGQNQFGGTGR